MSEKHKIEEEEIIAFLLGELNEEREAQIKKALDETPSLKEKKRILAVTLGLLEESSKNPISGLPDQNWKLSESRKNKIFSSNSVEEDVKKSANLLFWIPLGVAASALLIVLASGPDKAGNIEVTSGIKKEIKETTSTSKIVVDEKDDLNQMLYDRTQEGVTRELSARTTTDLQAMKEEIKLKEPPSLADEFAPSETLSYQADSGLMSRKSAPKKNAPFAKSKENTPSKMGNYSNESKSKNLTTAIKLPNIGFADGAINPPISSPNNLKLHIDKQKLARKNVQPVTSDSKTIEYPIPDVSLDKSASVSDTKVHLKPEGVKAAKKKMGNGYNLIDSSQSVFLFTPKAKALGRVKVIKREKQNIELLRLQETRLGKSVLLSGKDYQLRFSFDDEPPVIIVGNLQRKERVQEKENPNNINPLTTYIFQIKESWVLNEKEIRKPLDLNQSR